MPCGVRSSAVVPYSPRGVRGCALFGQRNKHRKGERPYPEAVRRRKPVMQGMKWAVLAATTLALQAQVPDQIRQATISGSRGTSGKCTIEVRVDMAAEVDVYGNSGRLRTMAGQPATWARMECTDSLPYNMSDFRFRGIDG